jgi:transcriptional regulator of arginine metabolism
MYGREHRHQAILEVINAKAIGRQADLGKALQEMGVRTTQSTLSKDIRELGIVKVPSPGGFRYRPPTAAPAARMSRGLLERELVDFVTGIDGAGNTLVLNTITGHAQAVCESIDQASWEEVVGTIAGENTIFVLCRTEGMLAEVRERIGRLRA